VFASVDGANWAEVLTGFATVGIAIGVIFAGLQVRDGRKARAAEIVRELAQQWASPELIDSRRFIASYKGQESVELLIRDMKAQKDTLSDEYLRFTRYLNFWEEIGLQFCDHSAGLRVVDKMFGDAITAAWYNTWKDVIPGVWDKKSQVGAAFGDLVEKIERNRKWRRRRRRMWRWFSTAYYDKTPPGGEIPDAP
jgi:hypothetical protein